MPDKYYLLTARMHLWGNRCFICPWDC